MSQKRVFSNNNDLTFNEYIVKKKGNEMMKSYISQKNKKNKDVTIEDNSIKRFLSYENFLILAKTIHYAKNPCGSPETIMDAKTSFFCYENVLKHMQHCGSCAKDYLTCEEIKPFLFPYGNYVKTEPSPLYFPRKINLSDWRKEEKGKEKENHCGCPEKEIKVIEPIHEFKCVCDCDDERDNEEQDKNKKDLYKDNDRITCNEYDDRFYLRMKRRNCNSGKKSGVCCKKKYSFYT